MALDSPTALFVMQAVVVSGLAMALLGAHKIQESSLFQEDDQALGWLNLVAGALMSLVFGCLALFDGWLAFGIVFGLPALASIPVYWLYRSRERSRVFIRIVVALWLGLAALAMSMDTVLADERGSGYWGLVTAALVSGLVVYGYRKLYFRKLTLSSDELKRAAKDPWGTIGAAVGVSAGGVILRAVVLRLAPEFQAAVNAFLMGLLAFSILGCAGWQLVWEITRGHQ